VWSHTQLIFDDEVLDNDATSFEDKWRNRQTGPLQSSFVSRRVSSVFMLLIQNNLASVHWYRGTRKQIQIENCEVLP
jgi:hypothetical protein